MAQLFQGVSPSRLPGEVINAQVVYFNDFITGYPAVDLALSSESDPTGTFADTADRGEWLHVITTGGVAPIVQDNGDGGQVAFNCDGDAGDHSQIQLNGEAFTFALGRRLIWESRLKFSNVTSDMAVGLSLSGTDLFETPSAVGVFAFTLTADADLEYYADTTGGATPVTTDTGFDIIADTFHILSFEWDGVDEVRMYADGASIAATTVNMPIGRALSPFFVVQSNGSELAITIDYIYVAMDRA